MLSKTSKIALAAVSIVAVIAGGAWLMINRRNAASDHPRRIGIVQLTTAIDAFPEGMKQGMADFGYDEGKDVVYEYDSAEQDPTKAKEIIQRYVDENVDVMFVITNMPLALALEATAKAGKRIPIVFVGVDKPVETGLIAGFSSSENNSTGIMGSVTENVPRQLALLREIDPSAKRIGIFGKGFFIPEGLGGLVYQELMADAPKYGFQVVEYKTDKGPDPTVLESEFKRLADGIKPGDIDAIMHIAGHYHPTQQFLEIALAERLQHVYTIMPTVEEVQDGGVFGYAPDLFAVGKDSAVIIDKLLRGAKPEDVPVEYPRHNVLWVNLDAAKRDGVTIPDSVLTKADKRIGE